MTNGKYILNKRGEPVLEPDLYTWGEWFEGHVQARRVARTEIGPYLISTVFLGLDHGCGSDNIPILWETMVFKLSKGETIECDRCGGSREQAEALHAAMVEKLEAVLALNV